MASYDPQSHLREEPIANARQACVLFIDTQNYNCHRNGAIYKAQREDSLSRSQADDVSYFFNRLESTAIPAWARLRDLCRAAGVEVMYTVIQSLTSDGRDRSRDYVLSGFHVPPGCWDAQVIDELRPEPDDMVLPKTSSSVFNSTNIDFILRSMGKRHLILAGCVTDQCVAHALMDACDLGYAVTLVPEATATYSPERQDAALAAVKGYCRMRSVAQLADELLLLRRRPEAAASEAQPPEEEEESAGADEA